MSKKIILKIVTPEKQILEESVDQVSLPTPKGEVTILPDHIPFISSIASGDIVAVSDDEPIPMAISGGFFEVKTNPEGNTEIAVLADFAELVAELSEEKIKEAKERAEELRKQMENKKHVDFEHFASELERSLTRVKIADKWKSKRYRK